MPSVIFNSYTFSKVFDSLSASYAVNDVPEHIEMTKDFDDCSPHLYNMYSIIGGYFRTEKINVKKMGKTWDEVQTYIDDYHSSRFAGTLSQYLKKVIVKIPFDYDTLKTISRPSDVLRVTDDAFVIKDCIANVRLAYNSLKFRENEKLTTSSPVITWVTDSEERALVQTWEKSCLDPVCHDKTCCYNKKAARKISYNVSLLRSSCRSYGALVEPGNLIWIARLIAILEQALAVINCTPPASPSKNNLVMLTV